MISWRQLIYISITATIFSSTRPNLFVRGFLPPCFSLSLESSSTTRRDVIRGSAAATLLLSTTAAPMTSSALSESTSIRWGIVGLGDVTEVKSGPPFWKCEGSDLVAVMRRTPGKAAEFAKRVPGGVCVGYDNLDKFLNHPGLEAVYVSTRPGTHLEIAKKVADAGLACYVEKPVGRCASETQELTQVFSDKGLPLYTAYISRAYERTQALRKLLKDGVIGEKLLQVTYKLKGTGGARDMATKEIPWRLDAAQSGGGLIMDVGCHVIDRIDYLCGPLEQVQGTSEHRSGKGHYDDVVPVENYCHASATIGVAPWASKPGCEGAVVDLTWDFSSEDSKDAMDELSFVGSNGKSLKLAGMSPIGPIQVVDKDGSTVLETLTFDMPEHTGQGLIQAVTNDLLVRKKGLAKETPRNDVLSFGDNAIRAQKVIDAMLDPYYGGREIGYWSRIDSWPGRSVGKS